LLFWLPLLRLTPSPRRRVPLDDLRKIFTERSEMANVPNGVEILPKISIAVVGRTNITDRRDPTRSVDSFRRDLKTLLFSFC